MLESKPYSKIFGAFFAITLYLLSTFFSSRESNFRERKMQPNRIGFGMSTQADPLLWANKLGATWFLDWKTTARRSDLEPEYWQMVRLSKDELRPTTREIIALAIEFPGHTWVIGNEPDNIWQDNITAELYAQYYHDLYWLIKKYDPTASIAVGAVSQPTPLRLRYLDQVLESYLLRYGHKFPVDWWTMHAYVLREQKNSWGAGIPTGFMEESGSLYEISDHGDLSVFKQNIISFRTWMKNNDYQQMPLAITEYGILLPEEFGFSADRITDYLQQSSAWLYSQSDPNLGLPADSFYLVQKFAWFSLADEIFPVADLANLDQQTLTETGKAYQEISQKLTNP